MYTIDQIKNMLFDAVVKKDIKMIADVAYEIGQVPLLILDANSFVLAQLPKSPIGNQLFDETLSSGRLPYHYYEKLANDAVFDYTHKYRDIVYLNWGLHKYSPHFYAPVYLDGFLAAGITFICSDTFEPQEYDYAVMDVLAKAIGACVEKGSSCYKAKNAYLMTQLFTDGQLSAKNKAALLQYFKINEHKNLCLMVAQLKEGNTERTATLSHVCDYLEGNIMNVITLADGQQITILIYNISAKLNEQNIADYPSVKTVSEYLNATGFQFGISQLFTDLDNAKHYREQAIAAIEIGMQIHPGNADYFFQDYSNYYLAQQLLTSLHPELFIHPAFNLLMESDRRNKTAYIDTLTAYLENEQEVTKTAQSLNIHKSTLVYRIQKIQDLTSIDFNNPNVCTQLMINKCMYDLKKHTS